MKKSFTEEQIVKILDECRNDKKVKEIARVYSITTNTIYTWKRKYEDMSNMKFISY